MSFDLAVLAVYIVLAFVCSARRATAKRSEPTGKVVMARARLFVIYTLGAVILGGAFSDLVRDAEHWPFSAYPMYSELWLSKTYSTLRLYGVVQRSPLVEIQLDKNSYLQPFDISRLNVALGGLQENKLNEALNDCLTRYEALRRAGRHNGPPLVAMRLYKITWTLDPSATNIDLPDRKELLTEVIPGLAGGD
jgi:hypothetical protein